MLTSKYALCATRAIIDQNDNRVSIIDVLDGLASHAFPFLIPTMTFIWCISRDEGDAAQHNGSIRMSLNETQLTRLLLNINFFDSMQTRQVAVISGVVVPSPGTFRVIFELGELQAEYNFPIQTAAPLQFAGRADAIPAQPPAAG